MARGTGGQAEDEDLRTECGQAVWIPKPNSSKLRPLGVPTIIDRVVETAVLLVLEPIFGADLAPEQYAYRPDREAHDAIRAVHNLLNTGHTPVIDADLSGYFDSIPHSELLQCVARRVVDRHILRLVKAWLIAFTAYAMKGDEARMRAAGCNGYISKPIDVSTFARQVKRYLPNVGG